MNDSTPTHQPEASADEENIRAEWMKTFMAPKARTFLRHPDGRYLNSYTEADWQQYRQNATQPPAAPAQVGASGASAEVSRLAERDVLAERQRQISAEGWTPEHDDEHADGGMAQAAACYALHTEPVGNVGDYLRFWPWDAAWWKPKDRRSNLVRASALILAEIERIDRRVARGPICSDCGAKKGAAHNYGCMYSELDV